MKIKCDITMDIKHEVPQTIKYCLKYDVTKKKIQMKKINYGVLRDQTSRAVFKKRY